MSKTIVGLFDNASDARSVVAELVQTGISRDQISVMANRAATPDTDNATTDTKDDAGSDALTGAGIGAALGGIGGLLVGLAVLPIPGLGPVIAAGPIATTLAGVGIGAATGGVIGALTHVGVPEEHAHHYAEGVRRGGTLVTVNSPDPTADRVTAIMNQHHVVDVQRRASQWRETGWNGYDQKAPAYTASEIARERQLYEQGGQVAIPIVQESFAVGKREVQGGTVTVRTDVTERPVEAQVNLREEHVNVERRKVDRAVQPGDGAFREGVMEFKETVEEPVVSKTARVVEEVVVNKDVRQHTETVRDTVKRTDVQVEHDERVSKPANPPTSTPRSTR